MAFSWHSRLWTKLLLVAVLTIVPAILHGRYSNRWAERADFTQAVTQLESFPAAFGDWVKSRDGDPLRDDVVRELAIAGYIHRTYVNVDTGDEVTLLLIVGRPGPLVRHPPEICYANQRNVRFGAPRLITVSDPLPASRFSVLQYQQRLTIGGSFRVAYGYTADGVWDVPRWPRVAYGGEPTLYKIQMLRSGIEDSTPDLAPIVLDEFAHALVKAFRQHLNASYVSPGQSTADVIQ